MAIDREDLFRSLGKQQVEFLEFIGQKTLNSKDTSSEIYIGASLDGEVGISIDFSDPKGASIVVDGTFIKPDYIGNGFLKENGKMPTVLHCRLGDMSSGAENVSVDFKKISNFNRFKIFTIGKDTIEIIANKFERESYRKYMDVMGINEMLVLQRGKARFISPVPERLGGIIGDNMISIDGDDNINIEQHETKKLSKKDDLKVYETPSKILRSHIASLSVSAYMKWLEEEVSEKIHLALTSSEKRMKKIKEMFPEESANSIDFFEFISQSVTQTAYRMMKYYNTDIEIKPLENKENKEKFEKFHEVLYTFEGRLHKIFDLLDAVAKEGAKKKNYLYCAFSDKERFKDAMGRAPMGEQMIFFDPQMGSAKGFFDAADECGMGEMTKMFGLDIREDIDLGENGRRARVVGGVNTAHVAEALSEIFSSTKYEKRSASLLTFNNPPYSLDDDIAKNTIRAYANYMHISGVFPTKMKNFLMNNLASGSLIVEVPREETGYTDPNTPESFLFVNGKRFDGEDVSRARKPHLHILNKGESLEKFLMNFYAVNHFDSGLQVLKNIDIFSDKPFEEGRSGLEKEIAGRVENIRAIFKNMESYRTILKRDDVKEKLTASIQPMELAKSEKVFIDSRFYSPSNEYEYYTFNDVVTNAPLIIHYYKNSPRIASIIEEIAKERNIPLPVDKETISTEVFKVGEKYSGKKTKVTTESLGMMKYAYYPDSFDTKDEKSRKLLIDTIVEIYRDNGRTLSINEIKSLEYAMMRAERLVSRIEKSITVNELSREFDSGNKETLVLVDEYGMAISGNGINQAHLNVSIYDLYTKLEEKNLLNITDYVEVAELKNDDRLKIVRGFTDYVYHVTLADIAKFNNIDTTEETYAKIKEIMTGSSKLSVRERIKSVENTLKISEYVESFYRLPKSSTFEAILKKSLKKHILRVIEGNAEEADSMINSITESFNKVYEDNKTVFFGIPYSILMERLENSLVERLNAPPEEISEMIQALNKELNMNFSDLKRHNSVISNSAGNLVKTLSVTLVSLKERIDSMDKAIAENPDAPKDKIDRFISENTDILWSKFAEYEKKIASLMDHQISEPESFLAMNNDGVDSLFLLQKMRTGKTLKFLFTGLLRMMRDGDDMEVLLNPKNIKDIAMQMSSHFSILLPSVSVFAAPDKHNFKTKREYAMLYHDTAVINPFILGGSLGQKLSRSMENGGDKIKKFKKEFSKTIEMLEDGVLERFGDKESIDLDVLIEEYKDSPFINILHNAKNACK